MAISRLTTALVVYSNTAVSTDALCDLSGLLSVTDPAGVWPPLSTERSPRTKFATWSCNESVWFCSRLAVLTTFAAMASVAHAVCSAWAMLSATAVVDALIEVTLEAMSS